MSKPTQFHLRRPARQWLVIIFAVALLTFIVTIGLNQDSEVQAESNFLTSFRNTYPAICRISIG